MLNFRSVTLMIVVMTLTYDQMLIMTVTVNHDVS